jgi:DNA-directed RNA polymerase subunit N (RpoN/RPB10)
MASGQQCDSQEDFQQLMDEVGGAVSRYCSRRPAVAVMTVFGIGFFFGWKMKPW